MSHPSPPRSRSQPLARKTRSPTVPASILSLNFARQRHSSAAPLLRRHFREATQSVCDVCFRWLLGCLLSLRHNRAKVGGHGTEGLGAHWYLSPTISSHGPGPSAAVTELPWAVIALPAPERTAGQSALPEPPRIGGRACPGPDVPAAVTGQVMGPW